MSSKSKHSVHVCFFLPSPPGSYYQMTIYSRHPLGKRFHKHQDFKSRKGHAWHAVCLSQSVWLPFPSWAVPLAGVLCVFLWQNLRIWLSNLKSRSFHLPLNHLFRKNLQPQLGEGRTLAVGLGGGERVVSELWGMLEKEFYFV